MSEERNEQEVQEDSWLRTARSAFRTSTNFYQWALQKQLAKNLSNFRSKHPAGSKYHTESYNHRSKIFRPKTRSAIQSAEADAAVAFFATADGAAVNAVNEASPEQRLSAEIMEAVTNYRLENTIPWFLTCIGAFQDAKVQGVCVSYQYWSYKEVKHKQRQPVTDPLSGEQLLDEDGPLFDTVETVEVIEDKPCIDLQPVENVRIDPAANWIDPINSSPYVIRMVPMYVGDIKERMRETDPKTGEPKWKELADGEIMSALKHNNDQVRRAREGDRPDSKGDTYNTEIHDFDIAWCHENFVRKNGKEYVYWTLGTEARLTDPKPLKEVYPHCTDGKRPLVMGYTNIETHKVYPSGDPELAEGLQAQANEIVNSRIDNIRLHLSKRYLAKRNAKIDFRSLTRAIPGSVTLTDEPNQDIKEFSVSDVTGSAYQEQDRTNLDIDELLGVFSPGSVQSNRALNETVGGMNMLSSGANKVSDYRLRVFAETWVEPVLRQLVRMEQAYETDEIVLAAAGEKVNIQDMNVLLEGMTGEMNVRVNVGFGATNPDMRLRRIQQGLAVVGQFRPQMLEQLDDAEVIKEVFGALGYQDGSRFFKMGEDGEDPRIQQLMQQVQQMQQMLQGRQLEQQTRKEIAQMNNEAKLTTEEMRLQVKWEIERMRAQLQTIDKQLAKERNDIETGKLINQRQALVFQMKQKEAELLKSNFQNRMSQTIANDEYGMIPGSRG